MDALNYDSSDQSTPRQQLIEAIHQLPDGLVKEMVQFANYLLYRENQAIQASPHSQSALPEGKSEGYQRMKQSGLIGFGAAEADLSTTYKTRFAEEISQKHDHR